MSKRLVDRFPFAKIVTVLAIAFGIGLGLCGLSAVWPSPTNSLSFFSLAMIVLSFVGLVGALILWAIMSVIGGFSGRNSGPQTPFGNPDEDLKDRDKAP